MSKTSGKSAGRGRPSDYDPKYAGMLIDYCSREPFETKDGKRTPTEFPTLAGFAKLIGKHRETLNNWADQNQNPEFFDAYKRLKDAQEHYLVVNGLAGTVNAIFAIFTAKNVIGWRDKQKDEAPDVLINNYANLPTEQLEEKALELAKKIVGKKK